LGVQRSQRGGVMVDATGYATHLASILRHPH
jgi:hypothetical protein